MVQDDDYNNHGQLCVMYLKTVSRSRIILIYLGIHVVKKTDPGSDLRMLCIKYFYHSSEKIKFSFYICYPDPNDEINACRGYMTCVLNLYPTLLSPRRMLSKDHSSALVLPSSFSLILGWEPIQPRYRNFRHAFQLDKKYFNFKFVFNQNIIQINFVACLIKYKIAVIKMS